MPGITVQWVRHCSNFAQEEHIAPVQLPHPYPAQVDLTVLMDHPWIFCVSILTTVHQTAPKS